MNDKLKNLWRYIFPAMGGLFVTYLYNVVDGIFVGQGVGSAALGAVNIGVPFITFAVAVAAMFPMGGATVVAIRVGRGDKEGANHAFTDPQPPQPPSCLCTKSEPLAPQCKESEEMVGKE